VCKVSMHTVCGDSNCFHTGVSALLAALYAIHVGAVCICMLIEGVLLE